MISESLGSVWILPIPKGEFAIRHQACHAGRTEGRRHGRGTAPLYVAMTRAMDRLYSSARSKSALTGGKRLATLIEQ